MQAQYTRKQLADSAEIGVEAVRFYENIGILPVAERSPAGYRLYGATDVVRVKYVKRAQELGFSLNEIRDLIALTSSPSATRAKLKLRAAGKLREIRGKVRDLKKMAKVLEHLVQECDGHGKIKGCPIFEFMSPKVPAQDRRES